MFVRLTQFIYFVGILLSDNFSVVSLAVGQDLLQEARESEEADSCGLAISKDQVGPVWYCVTLEIDGNCMIKKNTVSFRNNPKYNFPCRMYSSWCLEAVTSEDLPEVTKEAFEDGSSTQNSEQL